MGKKLITFVCLASLLVFSGNVTAFNYTANLLANPSFELAGSTGWTVVNPTLEPQPSGSYGITAHDGSFMGRGGFCSIGGVKFYQDVDLTPYDVPISTGDAVVTAGIWFFEQELGRDQWRVRVIYLDASNSEISSYDSGYEHVGFNWVLRGVTDDVIPPGAKKVRLWVHGLDSGYPTICDWGSATQYVDDASLMIGTNGLPQNDTLELRVVALEEKLEMLNATIQDQETRIGLIESAGNTLKDFVKKIYDALSKKQKRTIGPWPF